MKCKAYKNYDTEELVWEEDWQEYAMYKLGVKITPLGKEGTYTIDQLDFMKEFTEWYFSDNWKLVNIDPDYIEKPSYENVMEDLMYERQLEKNLLDE